MNPLDLVRTAIGNSFRSKLRTGLTVVAIFIGAFTLTITSAIGTGISNYINAQVTSIGAADVLTITKTTDASASSTSGPAKYKPNQATVNGGPPGVTIEPITADDLAVITATPGLSDVNPITRVTPTFIEFADNGKFVLTINPAATLTKADLAAGAQLSESSTQNEVMLPTSYLKNLGFASAESAIGEQVTIGVNDYQGIAHEVTATVVGVQNETLLGSGVGLNQHLTTELSTIQSIGRPAGLPIGYSVATARIASDSTSAQIDTIKKDLADQGFTAMTVADQIGSFETVINGIIGVLNAFAVIALIAAGFGIINTLLMSVQERTREIGLMKAMGMSGGKVYALFSMEAVFIGFLGSAIGALVAIIVGSVVSEALANTALSGLPGLHVMQFAPGSIAIIILVVMLIAFLAGTLPARRAARQNPIDALRYE
ncbi:ABC transporter permease [Leifsonia kafniensis]|uniref:ABC transporter permease n=1 Tax=Leifsonia kafniensis TaxID=475957 RepID=A0ABP7L1H7_9MICO